MKLELSASQAREIIWGGNPEYTTIEDIIVGERRWCLIRRLVIRRESDSRFFCDTYNVRKTEEQDEKPFDSDEPNFVEVEPREVKIVQYFVKNDLKKGQS